MKAIWTWFKENHPMWLYGSLIVIGVSFLFIFLVNAHNVVESVGSQEEGYTLFGWKAFHLFTVIMLWIWAMKLYKAKK